MAYVYRHIRLDKNEPFYIGVGSDKYYKRSKNKDKRNPIWKKIARKTTYEIEILFDNVSIEEAKKKEVEFVSLYGRIANGTGTLANISGGGDGMFDVPQYLRKRFSEKNSGSGNPFYGKRHSEETRKHLSLMRAGKKRNPLSEETKKKISIINKGRTPPLKGKKDPKGAKSRSGINHHSYRGVIYCYNANGGLVKIFECIREAATFFNTKRTQDISRVISGGRRYYKGHVFTMKKEAEWFGGKRYENPYISNNKIKIIDTKTSKIYNTATDAANDLGLPHRNICRYLNGTRKNITTLKKYEG